MTETANILTAAKLEKAAHKTVKEGIATTITAPAAHGGTAAVWYMLDGRRLAGKPTAKGLYLHNGRKVMVK